MKKSELIEELVEAGIEDRDWLLCLVNELQRKGWVDQNGVKIRNLRGFLWRSWQGYRNSPWRDLHLINQRIAELSQRIDSIRSNPDNWHRDRRARWKHEEEHTPAYRAFVLNEVPRLTELYPERTAGVLAGVAGMLEAPEMDRIGHLASCAAGRDVCYSRDDLTFSLLRLEFSPAELPTFWDWARTHAPFQEKGRLIPELRPVMDECFVELKELREEKERIRQRDLGKPVGGPVPGAVPARPETEPHPASRTE